jgi:hypothetical protein
MILKIYNNNLLIKQLILKKSHNSKIHSLLIIKIKEILKVILINLLIMGSLIKMD